MRKLITLAVIVFSLSASAQKKDSIALDTVYVFSAQEAKLLSSILLESKVIMNGEQLSGKQLQELFTWMASKARVYQKEQPKK